MAEASIPSVPKRVLLADGTYVEWDRYHQPHPKAVGNNQSRNGFLYNCYTHPMGRFFQETIKVWLEKGIARIHDKEIPRYDKEAYVFDDQRLQLLQSELKALSRKHLNDNDKTRKRELVDNIAEIWLFMMKEDIYWRRVGLPFLFEFAEFIVEHKDILTQVTPDEIANREKWG